MPKASRRCVKPRLADTNRSLLPRAALPRARNRNNREGPLDSSAESPSGVSRWEHMWCMRLRGAGRPPVTCRKRLRCVMAGALAFRVLRRGHWLSGNVSQVVHKIHQCLIEVLVAIALQKRGFNMPGEYPQNDTRPGV